MAFIDVKNVSKTYQMGEVTIKAIDKVNFSIEKGELVVILGPSGAGKTTVLSSSIKKTFQNIPKNN